ncbi:hypothetical protein [Thalassobaculum sp.]|uniref:hypothetical protein n=1 Tax=Thalassobaculum sp. TaxID=2022740 RepID=UPI003B5B7026
MLKFVLTVLLFMAILQPALGATDGQPGAEAVQAALKEIIAELAENQITDARYSEELRAEIKRQRDFIVPTLIAAGPLKALKLLDSAEPTPDRRVDRFLAEHEKTSFEWTISQDEEGVVRLLVLAPPRVPATKDEKQTALAGATLTELIGELRDGTISEARYSKSLMKEVREQRDFIIPTLAAAGPLKTLKFLNSTQSEAEQPIHQFLAEHETTKFMWTISVNAKGVVTLLILQPGN